MVPESPALHQISMKKNSFSHDKYFFRKKKKIIANCSTKFKAIIKMIRCIMRNALYLNSIGYITLIFCFLIYFINCKIFNFLVNIKLVSCWFCWKNQPKSPEIILHFIVFMMFSGVPVSLSYLCFIHFSLENHFSMLKCGSNRVTQQYLSIIIWFSFLILWL